MALDWTEIESLLSIIDMCQGHPNLKRIKASAIEALTEIEAELAPSEPMESKPKAIPTSSSAGSGQASHVERKV